MSDIRQWYPIYAIDWMTSLQLRLCSVAARGLLIDLMCLSWVRKTAGRIDMPHEDIAAYLRLDLEVFNNLLAELLERGRVMEEGTLFHGSGSIVIPRLVEIGEEQTGKHNKRVNAGKARHTKNTPETVETAKTQPSHTKTPQKSKTAIGVSYGAVFAKFWEVYPRKIGKRKAAQVWNRMKLDTIAPIIMEAVERWKQTDQWTKDGGAFVPHPSTWLNRGGWEDETDIQTGSKTSGAEQTGAVYVRDSKGKVNYHIFRGEDWEQKMNRYISRNKLTATSKCGGLTIYQKEESK